MNKKMISQLAVALILAGVVACSGSSETAKVEPVKAEQDPNLCYFDGTEMRAPDWICGLPPDGYEIQFMQWGLSGIQRQVPVSLETKRRWMEDYNWQLR